MQVRRARSIVLAVAGLALVGKLVLAATTSGTNDITHWLSFLRVVRHHGPVGVYGVSMPYPVGHGKFIQLYNHPPLIGYFLELINGLTHVGFTPQFSIRAASSVADVVTAWVVFELLQRRIPLAKACVGGVVVSISPILIVISGFHGNTDPIFVMFVLLSVYLLADRARPLLGGAALALALGVKIVPVVVLPCLMIYAFRRGLRPLLRYLGSFVLVSALFWGPAMILEGTAVRHNVLGYAGLNGHVWGIDMLAKYANDPGLMTWIEGGGRMVIVALCALVPAVLVWWRPANVAQATALALCGFLAFTPSFATQYLAWAAAPWLVLSFGRGVMSNVVAGWFVLVVYNRWNGGLPWNHAQALGLSAGENVLGLFAWAAACSTVIAGTASLIRPAAPAAARSVPGPQHQRPGNDLVVVGSDRGAPVPDRALDPPTESEDPGRYVSFEGIPTPVRSPS